MEGPVPDPNNATVTLTFGDVAENGQNMEQIGEIADAGFSVAELRASQAALNEAGFVTEMYDLNALWPNPSVPTDEAAARRTKDTSAVVLWP